MPTAGGAAEEKSKSSGTGGVRRDGRIPRAQERRVGIGPRRGIRRRCHGGESKVEVAPLSVFLARDEDGHN